MSTRLSIPFAIMTCVWLLPVERLLAQATMELRPVRASGVVGVDWVVDPATHEMFLHQGGQSVLVELYVAGWGPVELQVYIGHLDCDTFGADVLGTLAPIATACNVPVDPNEFCIGVDIERPDYPFAGLLEAHDCDIVHLCPTSALPGFF